MRVNTLSPGNIWTPLWEAGVQSMPDPQQQIDAGAIQSVTKLTCQCFPQFPQSWLGGPRNLGGQGRGTKKKAKYFPICGGTIGHRPLRDRCSKSLEDII